MEVIKLQYNTVLCQTKTTDGTFLFLGNVFGQIFVYNIQQICYFPETEDQTDMRVSESEPVQVFAIAEKQEIQSLEFHSDFLIVGINGLIIGYIWNEKSQRIDKKAWEIKIPSTSGSFDTADVNSLYMDHDEGQLFAGCGDNEVYGITLENGSIFRTFSGHKDFVHCVSGSEAHLVSASEDGTVKLWDHRQKRPTDNLEPHKNDDLSRPAFGKWIGTVAVNDDWLICGGGPKLSLWHLRSLETTTIFDFPGKLHVSNFIDDNIIAGGEHSKMFHYTFNGDTTAEIPISATCVYSIMWQQEPYKFISVAGASNKVDICTNFTYRDIILNLYKNTWTSK